MVISASCENTLQFALVMLRPPAALGRLLHKPQKSSDVGLRCQWPVMVAAAKKSGYVLKQSY